MTYCTVGEARAAGAVGDDAHVGAGIAYAMARVDAFTGDYFEPRALTVVARVGGDGRALLPYRLTTTAGVTSVTDHDTGTDLTAESWRAYTSADLGDVDAIGIGPAHRGYNILVNGMEPWSRYRLPRRVRVTGQFGWDTVPAQVEFATAHLAALWTKANRADDDADPETPLPQDTTSVDPEGNVIPVVPPFTGDEDTDPQVDPSSRRTTGSRKADAMLIDFRRDRLITAV